MTFLVFGAMVAAALASPSNPSRAGWPVGASQEQDATYARQIEGLRSDPTVQAALRFVEEEDERTIADLIELTEIPAPPFAEEARAHRFLEMVLELGVDTAYIDAEGNVIALRRGSGSGEVVAISGHLDTVFPEGTDVRVRMSGDSLLAPGVADDARGLAVVLAILRALNQVDLRTDADLLFVGTVGEEGLGDLRGMKHLFREGGPRIDAFISVDGTDPQEITHMGLGSHRYRITFEGPGGHSWSAFGLANPAHALGRAIRHFQDAADPYTRSAPRVTSYNVGRIGGGTSVNAIPFEAWMEVDMRSEGVETLAAVDALLQAAVARALDEENALRRSGPALTVDIALTGDRASGEIPSSHPFVQRAVAVTRALGLMPALDRSSTDANVPIALGIPALTIGGGGIGFDAHSLAEGFINRDGHVGVQRALLILLAQAGVAAAS